LVVGRRTNVHVKQIGNNSWFLPKVVENLASAYGLLETVNAIDYFFINRNIFPWHLVPDIVVGRPCYDNFIIALARTNAVAVVDASNTIIAAHPIDGTQSNFSKYYPEPWINAAVIGPYNHRFGAIKKCQYFTNFLVSGSQKSKQTKRLIGVYRRDTSVKLLNLAND
jgi:hypothetical protein